MSALDTLYDDALSRIVILTGAAGSGKTTVAREWLARQIMSDRVRQPLVFSWSFYRQGYGATSGQTLADFYAELGAALGVMLNDGMLPSESAGLLIDAMRKLPVLLLLDGLEVLQDVHSRLHGGLTNGALAELLYRLGSELKSVGTWVLITSRQRMTERAEWSYPEVQHLKLLPLTLDLPSHPDNATPTHTALDWRLAAAQTPNLAAAQRLLAECEIISGDHDTVPGLVRRLIELLSGQPAQVLLLGISFFERPPQWDDLCFLLSTAPALDRLTEPWIHLQESGWVDALEHLQELGVAQLDASGCVQVHPRIVESLATEVRKLRPSAWVGGHRRLCQYFADAVEEMPDTLSGMEPLFRASWHGTQAGDFRLVYEEILFSRICRGNSGYPIFELGAYETGIHLARLITPDLENMPLGCDLLPDSRALLIHCGALCLRYLDRLEEAYDREKIAWSRTYDGGCTFASIGPISIHLLRCQHIFGDMDQSGPVLRRLMGGLARSAVTPASLGITPSFLADALGLLGASIATSLWAMNRHWWARQVLRITMSRVNKVLGSRRILAPGIGGPWQALVMLDAGDWRAVEKGVSAGELAKSAKRNRETGMLELIAGRVASAQMCDVSEPSSKRHYYQVAKGKLEEGLALVTRNNFQWWQCVFHLAIARLHSNAGEVEAAGPHFKACGVIAKSRGFKLLVQEAATMLD